MPERLELAIDQLAEIRDHLHTIPEDEQEQTLARIETTCGMIEALNLRMVP